MIIPGRPEPSTASSSPTAPRSAWRPLVTRGSTLALITSRFAEDRTFAFPAFTPLCPFSNDGASAVITKWTKWSFRAVCDCVYGTWRVLSRRQRPRVCLRRRDDFTLFIENDLALEGVFPMHAARPAILAFGHGDFLSGDDSRGDALIRAVQR